MHIFHKSRTAIFEGILTQLMLTLDGPNIRKLEKY